MEWRGWQNVMEWNGIRMEYVNGGNVEWNGS